MAKKNVVSKKTTGASRPAEKAERTSRLLAYSTAAGATLLLAPAAKGAIMDVGSEHWISASALQTNDYRIYMLGGASGPSFDIVAPKVSVKIGNVPSSYSRTFSTATVSFKIKCSAADNGVMQTIGGTVFGMGSMSRLVAASQYWGGTGSFLLGRKKLQHLGSVSTIPPNTTTYGSTTGGRVGTPYTTKTLASAGAFTDWKGYVGIKFKDADGATHYGWICFNDDFRGRSGMVLDWAYESEPDMAILTGATFRAPLRNAANLTFSDRGPDRLTLHWINGDGNRRIVVAHPDSAVSWVPTDGNIYVANTNFSQADDLGSGHRIVYDGTATNTTVTGLAPNRTYHFEIFELGAPNDNVTALYLTTGDPAPATGSLQTLSNQPAQVGSSAFFR